MEVSGDSRGYGRRNIARASSYGGRTEGDQFFGVQQQPYKSYAEVVLDQKKRSQGSGQDNIERVISIRRGKVKESRGVRNVNRYHFKLSKKRGGLGVLDKGKGRLISKQKQKPRVVSFCNASLVIVEKTRQTGVEESDIETSSSEVKGRSGFFLLKGECSRRANPIGPMVTDSVGLSGPRNQGVELKEINDGLQDQADNLSRPDKASLIGEYERGMLLGQDHFIRQWPS
ncbi:hypothetical protein LWI29_009489 [Acer saccharum]|uniref:Uncharacterized protein n=1 Tax=Acer saccharum TaxID=4024 RepID=A0AA39SVL3_ACESA|nr:hypothetical protein LWI29_009489 [Acer saccharum]